MKIGTKKSYNSTENCFIARDHRFETYTRTSDTLPSELLPAQSQQ